MVEEGGAAVSPEPRAEHGPGLRTQMARMLASACYKTTFHIHTHTHTYTHVRTCTNTHIKQRHHTQKRVYTKFINHQGQMARTPYLQQLQ